MLDADDHNTPRGDQLRREDLTSFKRNTADETVRWAAALRETPEVFIGKGSRKADPGCALPFDSGRIWRVG